MGRKAWRPEQDAESLHPPLQAWERTDVRQKYPPSKPIAAASFLHQGYTRQHHKTGINCSNTFAHGGAFPFKPVHYPNLQFSPTPWDIKLYFPSMLLIANYDNINLCSYLWMVIPSFTQLTVEKPWHPSQATRSHFCIWDPKLTTSPIGPISCTHFPKQEWAYCNLAKVCSSPRKAFSHCEKCWVAGWWQHSSGDTSLSLFVCFTLLYCSVCDAGWVFVQFVNTQTSTHARMCLEICNKQLI